MNNDETDLPKKVNTNPDADEPLGAELEARVVAAVVGEASAFETAELDRIAAATPALQDFKHRMESTDAIVAEAVRRDPQPLRLSAQRRRKLLATLGGTVETGRGPWGEAEAKVGFTGEARGWKTQRWIIAMAACATLGLFVLLEGERSLSRSERRVFEVAGVQPQRPAANEMPMQMPMLAAEAMPQGAQAEPEAQILRFSVPSNAPPSAPPSVHIGDRGSWVAGGSFAPKGNGRVFSDGKLAVEESATLRAGGAGGAVLGASSVGGTVAVSEPPKVKAEADEFRAFGGRIAPAASSQAVKKPDARASDEIVTLSPFTVTAEREMGYAAASTLSSQRQSPSLSLGNELLKRELTPLEPRDKKAVDADLPALVEAVGAKETSAAKDRVSTFSLHVSDVSFRLAQAALARGHMPEVTSIRPEEFYNAFDYGDPAPAVAEKIGCRIEQAAHPFLQQRNLVRIAMKVAATGRAAATPLRLTVLLDTSGSMEREDRVATVRRAIEVLVTLLGPDDRVTLIGFARTPRLLAENLPGDRARELIELIAQTPADGGTNIEEALKLASEQARRHRAANAQNRIVVITDGAANLGNAIPAQLAAQVEGLRQAGIAFDACGVGLDGLDDGMLEALTRQGDGRYYVLNSPEAADAGFAQRLAGAFRPAAQNVKLQVRFNPARVASYRLIGFEQHRLRETDFRNDQVDAAELAAEEAGVALYEIQPLPQGEGELGEVFVRFRDAATDTMVERSWTMNHEGRAAAFDRATPSLQLAGTAAFLAEKLRGGPAGEPIKLRELAPVVNALRGHYEREARVQELVTMFGQLRRLVGE